MCNQYESVVGPDVDIRFLVQSIERIGERQSQRVYPQASVPIVRLRDEQRVLETVNWGFVPAWAKALPAIRPTNARGETVATSGLFRGAFAKSRCLVPAAFYVEWNGEKGSKIPHHIGYADRRLFAFAGIWAEARIGGEPYHSCAIVTSEPNAYLSAIHHRMPVVLSPEDEERWLDPETPAEELQDMLQPCPVDWLSAIPVPEERRAGKRGAPTPTIELEVIPL